MKKRKFNGDRLKTARLYRGLTLAELGRNIDISKQSLSLYENGRNEPDFSKVLDLSKQLHFPIDYFYQKDEFKVNNESTYFRSLTSISKKSRISQIIKTQHIGLIYEVLYQYIDFPELNIPDFEFEGSDNSFDSDNEIEVEKIEKIAIQLREYWGLGVNPIKNLQYEMERNGILITGFDAEDEKVDAFSQRIIIDGNIVYIVVLSIGTKPQSRINFDMAHELGHILLHPWTEDLETLSNDEFRAREKQANIFAGAFLLPKNSFIEDIKLYPTDLDYYQHLKKKWNCSMQAMIYRTHQLSIITSNQYQYLMKQISKNGWRKKEPGDYPYLLNDNIFKGAIDVLIDNGMEQKEIMNELSSNSISLYSDEVEKLLNLEKGILGYKEDNVRPLKLKILEN